MMRASVVILAGGKGKRLGRDKATMELGGQTLLQRQIARLAALSDDLIVVERAGQGMPVERARVVSDMPPFEGVLAGLAAGLDAARHCWSVVVACDMPFINLSLLDYMLAQCAHHDVVVPRLEVGLEPLHALYHKRCLAPLHEALLRGERRMVSFYQGLQVRYVEMAEIVAIDPQGRSFFNINTDDDLAQAQAWLV
jgi:molybdenum cofactor guanylyltransferase